MSGQINLLNSILPIYILSAEPLLAKRFKELGTYFRQGLSSIISPTSPEEKELLDAIVNTNSTMIASGTEAINMRQKGRTATEVHNFMAQRRDTNPANLEAIDKFIQLRNADLNQAKSRMRAISDHTVGWLLIMSVIAFFFALAIAILLIRLVRAEKGVAEARKRAMEILAHDLKSPIATLSMSHDLLQEKSTETELAAIMKRALESIERLTGDILDRGKLDAGQMRISKSACDIQVLVEEIIENHLLQAKLKGIELHSHHESTAKILCDRNRVEQVLNNLIGNGLKFTPRGGDIWIRTRIKNNLMDISVTDTGPGIPEKELGRVFDPFWQVTGTSVKGSGLGLSIVKSLVEAHGGTVTAKNAPNQGAEFTVQIPVL
ncbi:MAG: HAMP domain-containing histidine kinase [Bdellovibrionales bacterium]|nr:HAMP domain-containing histidine kinase [Bdellovibrionales bacterium]